MIGSLMLALIFVVGAVLLFSGVKDIWRGVIWLKGGTRVDKDERPFTFWAVVSITLIVALLFLGESSLWVNLQLLK